jgi:hypothetical protein
MADSAWTVGPTDTARGPALPRGKAGRVAPAAMGGCGPGLCRAAPRPAAEDVHAGTAQRVQEGAIAISQAKRVAVHVQATAAALTANRKGIGLRTLRVGESAPTANSALTRSLRHPGGTLRSRDQRPWCPTAKSVKLPKTEGL